MVAKDILPDPQLTDDLVAPATRLLSVGVDNFVAGDFNEGIGADFGALIEEALFSLQEGSSKEGEPSMRSGCISHSCSLCATTIVHSRRSESCMGCVTGVESAPCASHLKSTSF